MPAPPLPPRTASLPRIPSLDGLRALSIFLVLALHTLQRFDLSHTASRVWYALFDGDTGVLIFFVISGYLITSLLLKEHQKRGSASLRGFYLRRAMRILPPIYAYIAVLILLGWTGQLALNKLDILSALFFFHNYAPSSIWSLEHFWTLSIEEQFYLLWPVLLLWCLRKPGPAGRLAAAKIALAVIASSPILRVFSFHSHLSWLHNSSGFHMRADSLMFGCLFALLQNTSAFERIYSAATRHPWLPPTVIVLSDFLGAYLRNYWQFPFGYTLTSAAAAFFLLWCVRNPGTPVGRILNARPVVHIGILSYSIYIWQTLFLHHQNSSVFGHLFRFLTLFPFSWIAILAVAELSFCLIERPSHHLRNHLIRSFHLYADNQHSETPIPVSTQ